MRRRLLLPPLARRRVRELSASAWPQEACGLLEGALVGLAVRVDRLHRVDNHHDHPHERYLIDPETYLRLEHAARRRGRTIVGVWHSHPHGDATPSPRDRAWAWPGWSYLIAGVTNAGMSELRCWTMGADDVVEQAIASR